MLRQRQRVCTGGSANAVHDLRVATRRLEEALRIMQPALPAQAVARLRRRARSIRRSLGPVRNADVLAACLQRLEKSMTGESLEAARGHRRRARAAARTLRGSSSGIAVRDIGGRVKAVLRGAEEGLEGTLRTHGSRMLADRQAEVQTAIRLARKGGAKPLHELRIALKQYRYTLELLDQAGSRPADHRLALARSLQQRLGELRDEEQALEWVRASEGKSVSAFARRLSRRIETARRRALAAVAGAARRIATSKAS